MSKLCTITGETLMSKPLEPIPFIVQSLLPQGLHILAGAPKVGKSWLTLWLCLQIAKGEPVWSFATEKRTVLYLCLEDSETRIQNRLFDITDDAPDSVHFAVLSNQLGDGLETQIEDFALKHPGTGLVVIDILQKVRRVSFDNAYANDYRDLGALKSLADKLGIAILLVHHLRKQRDDNPMNMVSGTTGITGAVDSSFVLERSNGSKRATLHCSGRDIESRELGLHFDRATHLWLLESDSAEEEETSDDIVSVVCGYVESVGEFYGTPSQLVDALKSFSGNEIAPSELSKKLLRHHRELMAHGVAHESHRSNSKRYIKLTRSVGSDGTVNDAQNFDSPVAVFNPLQRADLQQISDGSDG